jgi:hypothetical protein
LGGGGLHNGYRHPKAVPKILQKAAQQRFSASW